MPPSSTIGISLGALLALATVQRALAQSLSWKSPVSGSWSIAGNWEPANVPDMASEFAAISTPGTYSIDLDIPVSLGSISIDNPNATLNVLPGADLVTPGTTASTFLNNGLIVINPSAAPAMARMNFKGFTTFAGTGVVRLNAEPTLIGSAVLGAGAMRNSAGHSITGSGLIGDYMENYGLVDANQPGLTLLAAQGSGWLNSGALRASNSGLLKLQQIVTQSPTGTIVADGGTVELADIRISGGTLSAINSGRLIASGFEVTLDEVKTEGTLEIAPGCRVSIHGASYAHDGEIVVNSAGELLTSWLGTSSSSPRLLTGELTVTLNSPANTTDYAQAADLIFSPGVRVRGRGVLRGFENRGIIEAAGPSDLINVNSFIPTNTGIIRAKNGGVILFTNLSSIRQTQGLIIADGGQIAIQSTMSINGHIDAVNNGRITIDPGAHVIFNDTLSSGLIEVSPGASLTLMSTALPHIGTIVVNTTGEADSASLNIPESADMGSGPYVLNAPARDLSLATLNGHGTGTIDHAAGRSLIGSGTVYGNHRFRGLVSPGNDLVPIGTVAGSNVNRFELAATSTLHIDIASVSSFDQLKQIEMFSMAGTLELNPLPSYTPVLGDAITFTNNSHPDGKFDRLVAPPLADPNWRWRIRYGLGSVAAVVICAADFDANDFVTGDDFDLFIQAFSNGDDSADFNNDGFVTTDDFDTFSEAFQAGC